MAGTGNGGKNQTLALHSVRGVEDRWGQVISYSRCKVVGPCYGLNCVPFKFICQSPNSPYLRNVTLLGESLYRGNQAKVYFRVVPDWIQPFPYKRRDLDTEKQREDDVKAQKDGHPQAKGRGQEQPSEGVFFANTQISDSWFPELWDNKFLFKPPSHAALGNLMQALLENTAEFSGAERRVKESANTKEHLGWDLNDRGDIQGGTEEADLCLALQSGWAHQPINKAWWLIACHQ